ncbi:MAG: hypothetical protein WCK67_09350 [bacterium]
MIDSINYSSKKGIYRDLYRTIHLDNKKEVSPAFRERKGIYKDIYSNIELNNSELNINQCFDSFGNGFVSSLKSIFKSPKDFVTGLSLISLEWYLSTKKQLHIFSKLGKVAGVAQILCAINEMINKKDMTNACYNLGSGISSLVFGSKYTGLINCFGLVNNSDK